MTTSTDPLMRIQTARKRITQAAVAEDALSIISGRTQGLIERKVLKGKTAEEMARIWETAADRLAPRSAKVPTKPADPIGKFIARIFEPEARA